MSDPDQTLPLPHAGAHDGLYLQLLPWLTASQLGKLTRYAILFREWNSRINLVSRKDIDALERHHLLHALSMARWVTFHDGATVLDLGTGGGIPGIPLAIVFPNVRFTLVDSVTKKINAVRAMRNALELENVDAIPGRVESLRGKFDFVIGRAVTALPRIIEWVTPLLRRGAKGSVSNGLIYFKGTHYIAECEAMGIKPSHVWPLHPALPFEHYEGKFLVHIALDLLQRNGTPRTGT